MVSIRIGELQFAAAGDDMKQSVFGDSSTLQRDIAFGFLQQAVADDAARHLVAFGAGERASR